MRWRVLGALTETPTLESSRYQIRLVPTGKMRGIVQVVKQLGPPLKRTGEEILDDSFGEICVPDSTSVLLRAAFEWSQQSRFTFVEGRAASSRYCSLLGNLARKYRGGYRVSFESMRTWS